MIKRSNKLWGASCRASVELNGDASRFTARMLSSSNLQPLRGIACREDHRLQTQRLRLLDRASFLSKRTVGRPKRPLARLFLV